jgi:hypothetical protein
MLHSVGWFLGQLTDGVERETIENVTKLGLAPGATNNLEIAIRSLGLRDMSELTGRLQTWREKLSENLRGRLPSTALIERYVADSIGRTKSPDDGGVCFLIADSYFDRAPQKQ